ncbi:Farnesyl-diphosphate farnesyltransferase, partial [Nowakowskiella sp. JEL0078]
MSESSELIRIFRASLTHPDELYALVKYKITEVNKLDPSVSHTSKDTVRPKPDPKHTWDLCYYYLNTTSRSFARVIAELDDELRHPVCIFYLVLRGLDTIEDDLSIPLEKKLPILRNFHTIIYQRGWNFDGNGPQEKDRMLCVQFDCVIEEFLGLKERYQLAIAEITRKMGNGMADFVDGKRVVTMDDYNLYTHYVAGLVGLGLTKLFVASGLEDSTVGDEILSNNMGLFLQKTNIIKDFLEDLLDGRRFWPEEVWKQYVPIPENGLVYDGVIGTGRPNTLDVSGATGDLADLAKPEFRDRAMACLNHLCADALTLVPDCLEFLSRLKNPSVFNFCALPQLMAIATISLFFDNPSVFESSGNKIRRGQTVKLLLSSREGFEKVKQIYYNFTLEISRKNRYRNGPPNSFDTSFSKVSTAIGQTLKWIQLHDLKTGKTESLMISSKPILSIQFFAILVVFLAFWAYVVIQ